MKSLVTLALFLALPAQATVPEASCLSTIESSLVFAIQYDSSLRDQALRKVLLFKSIIKQNPAQLSAQLIQKHLDHHQSAPLLHPIDYAVSTCIANHLEHISLEEAWETLTRLETKLKSKRAAQ